MNYTPEDLQNIVFKKRFIGYSEDMVNEVLDKVIEDYTACLRENLEYRNKIMELNEALNHYKSIENSLKNSLVLAQKTSEEVKRNAYEKAENIIKEAEIKAQQIINAAHEEVMKLKREYEAVRNRLIVFRSKSENLINAQLDIIRQITDEA